MSIKEEQQIVIEYRSLVSLHEYPKNARVHSRDQIEEITRNIQENGFLNPILIDTKDGIIAGHGRYQAALNLKLDKVPVIQIKHLTDEQIRLYRIADNRLAEKSTWSLDLLKIEFEDLERLDLNLDLSISGWDPPKILELITPAEQKISQPQNEWKEMPSFEHDEDEKAFFTLKVHFKSSEAVKEFEALIKPKLDPNNEFEDLLRQRLDTTKADSKAIKSIWFPQIPIYSKLAKSYSGDDSEK